MDEKKLRVYTTAVSIAGLSVFLLSLWEVYPYYLPGSRRGDIWSYSLMMVLLMVVCRMLPIYFAEDKTLEISFVPVLACAITGGAPLAVVLFGVSTLFTVMQNPATKHYYWPLAREPRNGDGGRIHPQLFFVHSRFPPGAGLRHTQPGAKRAVF